MSENNTSTINNNTTEIKSKENKGNLFYLSILEITNINKLFPYGYKIVDEKDKDIQQYLKQKRIQEKKLKRKKFPSNKQVFIDKKKLAEKIRRLPDEQLKGILNLIDLRKEATEQKEFYELDIESLNYNRLHEIQSYVKSCFKSAGDSIPTRYVEEFKKKKNDKKEENLETV